MKGQSEKGELFAVLKLRKPKSAPKPRAKASSKASLSGKPVQLFRMVYHCKKGFQAEHL